VHTKRKIITIIVLIIIAIAVVVGILYKQGFFAKPSPQITNVQPTKSPTVNPYIKANIEIKTYKVEVGWGYDISVDGKLVVHQTNIPALPGNGGFKTEADARKVAELAVEKIRKNIMPPSLSVEELNNIGITSE
jgi:hypothetical protein